MNKILKNKLLIAILLITCSLNSFSQSIWKQNCEVVIIDFNKHFNVTKPINVQKITGRIIWRRSDFETGRIKECYIIFGENAIRITKNDIERDRLTNLIKGLMPQ